MTGTPTLPFTDARPVAGTVSTRDVRIDFFRGLALLCIFIDHIPGNLLSRLTLHNFGFSDAAELFVLLAGVSAGLAYAGRTDATRRILSRVKKLYVAQMALLALVAAFLSLAFASTGNPAIASHPAFAPFRENLPLALLRAATLQLQPSYLDILPLYIMLLLWLPVFLAAWRRQPAVALGLSFALWGAAKIYGLNIPGGGGSGWYFNPFAWQLLFCIGVVIGQRETSI